MSSAGFPDSLVNQMTLWQRETSASAARPPDRFPDKRLTDLRDEGRARIFPNYTTKHAWLNRANELRLQILLSAGLWPMPERPDLHWKVTRRIRRDDCLIENIYFETLPGFYVTGNLYRPVEIIEAVPGVANPHGHWKEGRFGDGSGTNPVAARCIEFARQGYAAFSYDMVGYGDRQGVSHRFGSLRGDLWGINLLGLQLWNSIRVLDFLESLDYVDAGRLGCTGASGGGTQTFLLAAVDERVKVAAPVNMVSAHYQGGCLCENAPGLRTDAFNVEFAACMAPRPLLLVCCTGDWTRNTPQVEYPAIKDIYELFGASERVRCCQVEAEHNYNRESREAVYSWFARWFLGRSEQDGGCREGALTTEPTEDLRVLPEGSSLPGLTDEPSLEDHLVRMASRQISSLDPIGPDGWERFRAEFQVPFRTMLGLKIPLPQDVKADVILVLDDEGNGCRLHKLQLGRRDRGEGIPVLQLSPLAPRGEDGTPPAMVMVHGSGKRAWARDPDGGEVWNRLRHWIAEGRTVFLPDPWLTGEYHDPARTAGRVPQGRHFTTYNLTDAALRVQDLVTVSVYATSETPSVDLWAREDAGLWALLARPFIQGLGKTLIQGHGYRLENDEFLLERCFIPGLRRLGGFRTAVLLAAPARLRMSGAEEEFESFLRQVMPEDEAPELW